MRLSPLLRVIIRGNDGQPMWKEISQLHFPKGGKTLSFKQTGLMCFTGVLAVFVYAQFQSDINPDSTWAKYYRTLTNDPMGALGFDLSAAKKDGVQPTISSPLQ